MSEGRGISEQAVEAFLNKLAAADADKKVDQIQFFGLTLEDATDLPESTLDALTGCVPALLRSNSTLLVTSVLTSFLPFYFPLLPTHGHHLRLAQTTILPALIEKLNDPKDRISGPARKSIVALGRRCFEAEAGMEKDKAPLNGSLKGKERAGQEGPVAGWERVMLNTLAGKGWRGKVEGLKVLEDIRTEMGGKFSLKPWLPVLAELLEDGESHVRDQARETSVNLLAPSSTPNGARAEFKRLMEKQKVRKTIVDPIWERIMKGSTATEATNSEPGSGFSGASAPTSDGVRSGAATPAMGSAMADDIPPVYIASGRDLEGEFARMIPHFQGKETEANWLPREKSVIRVRGMLRGQVHSQCRDAFIVGLKGGMMDAIIKTMGSLRTTVSQHSCFAIQELAEHLGSSFDPFVEGLLPNLWKMGGFTKKIIADRSQRAVSAIIIHSTARPQLFITQISIGVVDKNVQLRHHSVIHLKAFLDIQAGRHKSAIESHHGSLDQLVEAVEKSLADVNPQVRDLARAAFWSFHAIWPHQAQNIMGKLDPTAKKNLDKVNPREASGSMPSRPSTSGSSTSAAPPAKRAGSNMSALLAEKRKAAAKLAAERATHESPRVVSGPVPGSPALAQGMPRSSSSNLLSGGVRSRDEEVPDRAGLPESPSAASPARNGHSPSPAARHPLTPARGDPHRMRSSSLARELMHSPGPSASGSPNNRTPPVHANGYHHASTRSPYDSTPSRASGRHSLLSPSTENRPVEDAMQAQAAQAEQAAAQLLDFDDDDAPTSPIAPRTPATPARQPACSSLLSVSTSSASAYKTPARRVGGLQGWEDSPRNLAVTPQMLENLKGRRTERSWWLRQRQFMDQTTPLKSRPAESDGENSEIESHVRALTSGTATSRDLQKLTLYSSAHPIPLATDDDEAGDSTREIWEKDGLFERIFDGLMGHLQPDKDAEDLLQGMVLLWELVQKQWAMFEDYEPPLVDALFRLRACTSVPILESTNSLISLLSETSEPILLLSVIRERLAQYLAANSVTEHEGVRAKGFLFGLNGMGMCILRLPREVVLFESRHLEQFVMDALTSSTVSVRQAGQTLLLAIQAVVMDAQLTLSLFPRLSSGAKDLAVYFFGKNGLMDNPAHSEQEAESPDEGLAQAAEERKDKVMEEMVGLMARGMAL